MELIDISGMYSYRGQAALGNKELGVCEWLSYSSRGTFSSRFAAGKQGLNLLLLFRFSILRQLIEDGRDGQVLEDDSVGRHEKRIVILCLSGDQEF